MAKHGKRSTYQHGCKCLPCRASEALYRQQLRRAHAQRVAANPEAYTHGNVSTYRNHGCRCAECRKAHAEEPRNSRRTSEGR
jgi:hypothetical protein